MTTALRIGGDATKALPRKINFSIPALERLTCPDGRDRVYIFDNKVPGLAVAVTAGGAKVFYVIRKVAGRKERVRLGGVELSIEQARKLAMKINGTIADGANPAAAKRVLRESETLQELFDRFAADLEARKASPATLRTDASRFDTCLAAMASRRVLSIREGDIRQAHQRIGKENGHVSANRSIQLLRRMFNWARLPNPVTRGAVDLFAERSRERFLTGDELRRLFLALDDENISGEIRDFVRVCLFTGARRSNVAAMHVSEIDVPNRTWTVPQAKSKNRQAIRIHLSEPALKIITPRLNHPSGFVFPGDGKTGHLIEPKRSWARILKVAGLDDVRIHDLRRSLGSWMAAGGSSLAIVGKALGHRSQDSTKIYARLDLSAVRESVDAAAAAMLATMVGAA
jgi:integrase